MSDVGGYIYASFLIGIPLLMLYKLVGLYIALVFITYIMHDLKYCSSGSSGYMCKDDPECKEQCDKHQPVKYLLLAIWAYLLFNRYKDPSIPSEMKTNSLIFTLIIFVLIML